MLNFITLAFGNFDLTGFKIKITKFLVILNQIKIIWMKWFKSKSFPWNSLGALHSPKAESEPLWLQQDNHRRKRKRWICLIYIYIYIYSFIWLERACCSSRRHDEHALTSLVNSCKTICQRCCSSLIPPTTDVWQRWT